MQIREVFDSGLSIKPNLYFYDNPVYYPQFVSIAELSKGVNIHRTTLRLWQKQGLVKSNNRGQIELKSLVNHVLNKSKKKSFGRSCTWWTKEELETFKTDRSPLAKKIMKHRINKGIKK
jgi:hypothetical protein